MRLSSKVRQVSGDKLDLDNVETWDPKITNIAHGLSNLCRYAGQCPEFYSVAAHSIHLSYLMQEDGHDAITCLAALLHDASEAFLADIPSPVKGRLEGYTALENKLMGKIIEKYKLTPARWDFIKQYDVHIHKLEVAQFWGVLTDELWYVGKHPVNEFIRRFEELSGKSVSDD